MVNAPKQRLTATRFLCQRLSFLFLLVSAAMLMSNGRDDPQQTHGRISRVHYKRKQSASPIVADCAHSPFADHISNENEPKRIPTVTLSVPHPLRIRSIRYFGGSQGVALRTLSIAAIFLSFRPMLQCLRRSQRERARESAFCSVRQCVVWRVPSPFDFARRQCPREGVGAAAHSGPGVMLSV